MQDIEIFAPEFEYSPKGRLWYMSLIFLSLLFMLFALIAHNTTFIAVIALGATLIATRGNAKPRIVPLVINDKGIYFKNKFWKFSDLRNFSIYEYTNKKYFIFAPSGRFQTPMKVPIRNSSEIRRKLNNLLPEVEYQESLIDSLITLMGF